MTEAELRSLDRDALLELGESLGLHLDINGEKEALLGRLFRHGL